ncbi:hypothetical protein SARC_09745 [Sphaeroforma arctica JP610]|uniref:Deacetylase sirtuin-type domain-containing protein n=1 Tax=Sphaeroforma arctica JP610 TaxID=667725 RepID=A0A0L0FMS4_9EUKA|nr:hypothetical protein SARC_09745 [Sphaeroforma arctica JP610]KNC77806.1 hypothetical protein SARC_09745 [Sphaeroforma arctica JP610]|eukprot:XP_014151708.1 hypothetical protein SARC_09745 [Sphaeroforma arctica JP610]
MHQHPDAFDSSDSDDDFSRILYEQMKAESRRPSKALLPGATLQHVADYIKSGKCKRIVVLQGAGVSTSAGIPDFRGPKGLYSQLEKYQLPYPEAIFDIGFFEKNPVPFFSLAKSLFPGNFKPTYTHFFVRMLQEKSLLKRCFTQNIDALERRAGIDPELTVEAHGSFASGTCMDCGKGYPQDYVYGFVNNDQLPCCAESKCEGVVKPDIVFFGENLPARFDERANEDFDECDLLLIMGTSLKVAPFSHLCTFVDKTCVRLMLNLEVPKVPFFDWSSKLNRDVRYLGTCDEGCRQLTAMLGWEDELNELIELHMATLNKEDEDEYLERSESSNNFLPPETAHRDNAPDKDSDADAQLQVESESVLRVNTTGTGTTIEQSTTTILQKQSSTTSVSSVTSVEHGSGNEEEGGVESKLDDLRNKVKGLKISEETINIPR